MKFKAAHWLFALKLYLAIMLAFFLSSRMGLAQTYWTVVTCCVVMNPMSGAMRSKAAYRFTGTLCAGIVALALASWLAHAPLLMLISVGLIGSAAFGASLLDRTPRSYGLQLFGLTLVIIVVPAVNAPGTLFDTMVTRLCEIGLAIICCTVVDSVIFPRSLWPTVLGRLDKWLADMEEWLTDAFAGRQADTAATHDRLSALADIGSLSVMAAQLRYDPLVTRQERRTAFCIQARLLQMVPLLYAISERVADAAPETQEKLRGPLSEVVKRAHAGEPADKTFHQQVTAIEVPEGPAALWRGLVRDNLAELAERVLKLWAEVQVFKRALEKHEPLPEELAAEVKRIRTFPLWPDLYLARQVFLGCVLTYTALITMWGLTGWPQSTLAIFQGVVTLAFCGGSDEADQAVLQMGKVLAYALLAAGVFSYGLLPLAKDFPTFAVVMALFVLPMGALTAKNPIMMLVMAAGFSSINFQRVYAPYDFGYFLDVCLATMVGVFAAFSCVGLVRVMGSKHALDRLRRWGLRDILKLTHHATPRDRDLFLNRALNRIGLLAGRLSTAGEVRQSKSIMQRMRAGVWIAELRQLESDLSSEERTAFEGMFETLRRELPEPEVTERLLTRIDATLSAAWGGGRRSACDPFMRSLIGLRLVLFEFAEAWRPTR